MNQSATIRAREAGHSIKATEDRIRLTNATDNEILSGLTRTAAADEGGEMHVRTIETVAQNGNTSIRVAVLPISHAEKKQLDDESVLLSLTTSVVSV